MKTIIIAEAGVNHNGSMDLAIKMIYEAKNVGADYIKFQTAIPELVMSKHAPKANYQLETTSKNESQLEMAKAIHLPLEAYASLKEICDQVGIRFVSTPFDLVSIDYLNQLGMDFFKIPSGEITNYPYLKKIAHIGKPVILSTGMSTMYEIKQALEILTSEKLTLNDITILHCNTEYPTPMEDVNLRAMLTIGQELGVKVGYSDHTQGIEVPIAAVTLGATVIEKHFTLDRNMEGPDHKASLKPDELKAMIKAIRNIEKALGNGEKTASSSEVKNINITRKSIVASKFIVKGDTLTEKNLTVKRPGNGISPMYWDKIIGEVADRDYNEDDLIESYVNFAPLISIIIPIYNVKSEYLIACIESVLNQTYSNMEILLIDDKSTDPTILPILQQYKKKDNRIVLIEKTINEGVSLTRQYGINIAKGEYLFFIDCDDYITHDCIESLLNEAIRSKADIVIGDNWLSYKTYKIYQKHEYDINDPDGYLKALLTGQCGGTIWNKLIKTEKIRQLDLPNIHLRCNDTLINFYITNKNFKIKCLGKPLYNWVQQENSVTQTKSKPTIEHGVFIVKWVNNFVSNNFNSINLKNELAYYNLSVWALLLAQGIKRPYSCDAKDLRNNIYKIYWKNKWAKQQLSIKNRLIIQFNKYVFLSIFYKIYSKIIKPFFKKNW